MTAPTKVVEYVSVFGHEAAEEAFGLSFDEVADIMEGADYELCPWCYRYVRDASTPDGELVGCERCAPLQNPLLVRGFCVNDSF